MLFMALLFFTAQADSFQPHVANGRNAIRGQFPFITHIRISIDDDRSSTCTGSLIGPFTVLTAAHCCVSDFPVTYQVTINAYLVNDGVAVQDDCTESYTLTDAEPHPAYTAAPNFENDLCILRLPEPSAYTPIPLYDSVIMKMSPPADSNGKRVIIAGFGTKTGSGAVTDVLQKASTSIFNLDRCVNIWEENGKTLNKSKIVCGDTSKRKDVCGGDSGGALFTKLNGKFLQLGAVSFGASDCSENNIIPGIYTKIDDPAFRNWALPILAETQITRSPTQSPTSRSPTQRPSKRPSGIPTLRPSKASYFRSPTTKKPTKEPSVRPTRYPTKAPSFRPTRVPTAPTHKRACVNNMFP